MFPFGVPLQFISQGYTYPETSLGRVVVCPLFSNNFLFSLFFEVRSSLLLHVPVPWEQCHCSGCIAVSVPLGAVPGHAAHWKYINFNSCSNQGIPEVIKIQILHLFLSLASAFSNNSLLISWERLMRKQIWLSAQVLFFFFLWLSL